MPKIKEIQEVVQKLSCRQKSVASGRGPALAMARAAVYEPVQ